MTEHKVESISQVHLSTVFEWMYWVQYWGAPEATGQRWLQTYSTSTSSALWLQLYYGSIWLLLLCLSGAEAGMRELNSGFHGADRRPGTVSQPLASLVCVITAPLSSRPCFCGVASERLMGWKETLAQRYGSRSPLSASACSSVSLLTLFLPLALNLI